MSRSFARQLIIAQALAVLQDQMDPKGLLRQLDLPGLAGQSVLWRPGYRMGRSGQ
jgi:hypothetical protein